MGRLCDMDIYLVDITGDNVYYYRNMHYILEHCMTYVNCSVPSFCDCTWMIVHIMELTEYEDGLKYD